MAYNSNPSPIRIAEALERIAKALEEHNKPTVIGNFTINGDELATHVKPIDSVRN